MSFQVLFLTGQSDPSRNALSPLQTAFARALPIDPGELVPVNFPYREDGAEHRRVPFALSSVRNVRHYFSARRPGFAERHADAVRAVLARASHSLILAGSCGLELLGRLGLSAGELRADILAYGPVVKVWPRAVVQTVVGRWDVLSQRYVRRPDHLVDCGHLGYLGVAAMRDLASDAVVRARAVAEAATGARPSTGRTAGTR